MEKFVWHSLRHGEVPEEGHYEAEFICGLHTHEKGGDFYYMLPKCYYDYDNKQFYYLKENGDKSTVNDAYWAWSPWLFPVREEILEIPEEGETYPEKIIHYGE